MCFFVEKSSIPRTFALCSSCKAVTTILTFLIYSLHFSVHCFSYSQTRCLPHVSLVTLASRYLFPYCSWSNGLRSPALERALCFFQSCTLSRCLSLYRSRSWLVTDLRNRLPTSSAKITTICNLPLSSYQHIGRSDCLDD